MVKKLFIIIICFLFFFQNIQAQTNDADISLTVTPSNPSANQNIKAFLSSSLINLDKSLIKWYVNGQGTLFGIGKKELTLNSGEIGTSTNISVDIETIDGAKIEKNTIIKTSNVDMLWEATTSYVPPFYKGKKLPLSESEIKVVAIPSFTSKGASSANKNLSYAWVLNESLQTSQSGWGKNYFIFTPSYLDTINNITVRVSDITGTATAVNFVETKNYLPKIVFYKKNKNLGTDWNSSIENNYYINPEGETFIMEPYFFSIKDIADKNLSIKWYINNQELENLNKKNNIFLKIDKENNSASSAILKVVVENNKTLFQQKEKKLSIGF